MKGYALIKSHPYMAKTDADGRFSIKNLPAGEHVFQFWHEKTGWLGNARFGSHVLDKRGRLTISITEEVNDIGITMIPAAEFNN